MPVQQPGISLQFVYERMNKLREQIARAEASLAELESSLSDLEIDASQVVSGTLDTARIPDLDAAKITSGALAKARQHAQTAFKDEANTFTQDQTVNGNITVSGASNAFGSASADSRVLVTSSAPWHFGALNPSSLGIFYGATADSPPWAQIARSGGVVMFKVSPDGVPHERNRSVGMGVWQSYTPAFGNVTVGNGTLLGRYTYIAGKTVAFEAYLGFGSTTSVAGGITVTTPTAHRAFASSARYGEVGILDASAGARYIGAAFVTTSPALVLTSISGAPAVVAQLTASSPITFATDDQIYVSGVYEEA